MPNRILKETIRTSDGVNDLSDFQFRLWAYLITYVDDYGRGMGDPDVLKGFVFPKRKSVTSAQVGTALHDLAIKGMITLYEVDEKPYFCFPNWSKHQTVRAKYSKYPAPEEGKIILNADASTCKQMQADASKCMQMQAYVSENRESRIENTRIENTRIENREPPISPCEGEPDFSGIDGDVLDAVKEWLEYKAERKQKYKPKGLNAFLKNVRIYSERCGGEAVAEAIRNSMASGYQGVVWDRLKGGDKHESNRGVPSLGEIGIVL